MDYNQKSALIRRISSGKLYCSIPYHHEEYEVIFIDPNLDLLTHADWIYKKEYKNCLERDDMMTLQQSYDILRQNGTWSDKMDDKLKKLEQDLKNASMHLNSLRFQKLQQRIVKQGLEKKKKEIKNLEGVRDQLYPSTIEYICESRRRNFIISRIVKVHQEELLQNPHFLDILAVYYYDKNAILESEFRELARTDPWRLYWTLSKETGTPLFQCSATQITQQQYAIISWSRLYDFVYQSQNRPSDDVIADDDQLDAWYENEISRIDRENKTNSVNAQINGIGGQEVFIPADAEGAPEVYALNDPAARARVHQRQKALEKAGELKHHQLPDVQMDIQMAANQAASSKVLGR